MSELIDRFRRYAVIEWNKIRRDTEEIGRYEECSFSHNFMLGQASRGKQIVVDLRATFPNLDNECGASEMSVEKLKSYALRQRGLLGKDKKDFEGMTEGSYDHAFTCGLIKRGEQSIINLYVTCPQLGSVEGVRELWE